VHLDLQKQDRFLLCSDGLHGYVEDNVIENVLAQNNEPETICEVLIEKANQAGGKDNITTVVVFYK